ncbi:LysR family transcriptional regulator [Shewanella youngdeokensis]|uniref:LysR family transcriptional regulator n=1 Tax=Shewanella youngdeokensis TaxID=2999068 RepID=A0ABZ0K499_9GAMM|nr:LysR family transcriptional regulator [Shewanella sp. DAU334]
MNKFNNLSVNSLILIKTLYEEGSTLKAAKRLNMSQSNVSYELKKLRELFNDPLFIKGGDGLIANSRVTNIYQKIPDLLCELENLYNTTEHFSPGDYQGSVTIAIIEPLALGLIPILYKIITKQCPNITLTFNIWSTDSPMQLVRGEIDVAIHVNVIDDNYLIETQSIIPALRVIACRKHHPLASHKNYNFKDICQYPMLLSDVHHATPCPNFIEKICIEHGLTYQVAARCNYLPAMVELLLDSNSTFYSAKISLDKYADKLVLLEPPVELTRTLPNHSLLFPKSQANSPFNQWLRTQIEQVLINSTEASEKL